MTVPRFRRRPRPVDPEEVAGHVDRLVALVGAGATPFAAWTYLAAASGGRTAELARAVGAAARAGEPLGGVFAAAEPAWRRVGAIAALAADTGAPLAPALAGAARSARSVAELRRTVAASVAGPAASARLVLLLPPVCALLGWAFGFDVPGVLLGGPVGFCLLVVGAALLAGAALWSRRLIRVASAASWTVGLHLELVATAVRSGAAVPTARRAARAAAQDVGLPVDEGTEVDDLLAFAADAGLPVVALLQAEADRLHRAAVADAGVRASVLAVRLLVPLGALVLPAFLLLGAVPIGIAVLTTANLPL